MPAPRLPQEKLQEAVDCLEAHGTHQKAAKRSMVCIVHHAEHGEIDRHRCGVSMI